MNELRFNNYSRFIGTRHNYRTYAWCVFLDINKKALDAIDFVEYILHPSFPNPVRRAKNADQCFALQSEGWGRFLINITV